MWNGRAAEHILDLHLAVPGAHTVPPLLQQLEHRRQRPDRDPALAAGAPDPCAGDARGQGIAMDDLVGLGLVEDAGLGRASVFPRSGEPIRP